MIHDFWLDAMLSDAARRRTGPVLVLVMSVSRRRACSPSDPRRPWGAARPPPVPATEEPAG